MFLPVEFEIRSSLIKEEIHMAARSRNGVDLPALDFTKRFYRAECNGEGCIVRLLRDAPAEFEGFKRGDKVKFLVTSFQVDRDVANFNVAGIAR